MNAYSRLVKEHYISNWGDAFEEKRWTKGPINNLDNDLAILEFKPTDKRKMWTYATSCMSTFAHKSPIELHLFSAVQDDSLVELLTAIAYFHTVDQNLGIGHTVNFGRPWQGNSVCDYGLISLPYLDGPSLESLDLGGNYKTISCYWLIPITLQERDYKIQHGLEALEERLEEKQFNYLDNKRKSVI